MTTEIITVPVEVSVQVRRPLTREERRRRGRRGIAFGMLLVALGLAFYMGITALLLAIPVEPMETLKNTDSQRKPANVSETAAELWAAKPVSNPYTLDKPVVVDRPANPHGVPLFDEELAALYETAEVWRFNPDLGLALIWTESRYEREAVNEDCYGLCQLKERYFPGASSMTGAENIRAGLTYLGQLLEKYDNLDAALTAYRWGHDNGDRTYAAEVIAKLEELAVNCY